MIKDFYTVGRLALAGIFFFLGGFFFLRTFYGDFKQIGKFELIIISVLMGILINIFLGFLLGVFELFTTKYILLANLGWILFMELLFFVKHKEI